METPALERQKVEHHLRKRNLCFAALAFVILIPLPLALIGQVMLAGILCILTAIFVGMQPEFGAEPKVAMHDFIHSAGNAPLPAPREGNETTAEQKVLVEHR